eukprot:6983016-Ditylum_brightwellii.AAC.1
MAEALANLAQAIEEDCTTVANLANANTQLTNDVANLTGKLNAKVKDIATLSEKIGQLTTSIEKLSNKQNTGGDRNQQHTSNNAVFYCWTHGVTHSQKHQNSSCKNPQEYHQKDATFWNCMGVSTKGI